MSTPITFYDQKTIGPQIVEAHVELARLTRSALVGFGGALRALKAGRRVAREGWNDKGMWLVLMKPGRSLPVCALTHEGSAPYDVSPCIGLKTAGGDLQPGWLASQPDMLAEDWRIVS